MDETGTLTAALAGRYEIVREIGRGGMATVYLARDLKHDRQVALKVLKPELGAVLGVERFLAEIKVTANLQHPNLLPLFDSGEAAGLLFYVMPFVAGESLRARLDREKQLPVDEAVRIAVALANALGYAHEHGVIHRDLKPENILLQAGQPVIADFGIALAVSNAGGQRITQTGLSLGTPQYMSPEQATGDRTVDGRSDIYSLAAMTYEALAGEAPHLGNTVQAIVAKVLTEKPVNVRVRRSSVPEYVAAALERALEKTPADRFSTAHEFAAALGGGMMGHAAAAPPRAGGAASAVRTSRANRARELAAWVLVAVLAAWFGWQQLRPRTVSDAPVVRAAFDMAPNERVHDGLIGSTIAVSPRGDLIAYTAIQPSGFRMYIRHTNELAARLADASIAGRNLAFSPDGRWLAFTQGNELRKISVDGGQSIVVATTPASVPYGASWAGNDRIVVGSMNGLYVMAAGSGTARAMVRSDSGRAIRPQLWPLVLPDGHTVVYAQSGAIGAEVTRLGVLDIETGTTALLDLIGTAPLGLIEGQLVYLTTTGTLMAVPWDARRSRPNGEPIQLDDGVLVDAASGAKASLSQSGTLAFLHGRSESQPVLMDGKGASTVLVREAHQYGNPRYSPDGRQIAISVQGLQSTNIFVYDIARNTFTKLTTEGINVRPEWTPDGKRILFRSERAGKVAIWWQPADGSAPAELLYAPDIEPYEAIMSPDAKWLIYRTAPGGKNSRDIFAVPLAGERVPVPLVTGPASETMPRLSPDGRWLAYQSNETGRFEVYVRPFPGAGARVQVSDEGGSEPLWGRSGRVLHYRRALGDVASVDVTTGASFSIGARRSALAGEYLTDPSHAAYDIAPDGRFLMLKRAGEESKTVVVYNWRRELREKLASVKK